MKKDWWKSFFSGLWLEYQKGMDSEERVLPAADFLEIALKLEPGTRILDAPCGEGRLGRELARRGHKLTGLDANSSLLREGRKLAKSEGLAMDFIQGDLRKGLPGRKRFDLALCWWSSFGYFDAEDNLRHVKSMARSLAPGGLFVLDTHSAETLLPGFEERQWEEVDGIVVTSLNDYDVYTGRLETEWTLIREGKTRQQNSSIRLYTVKELCDLFTAAGFTDFQSFGSLEGDPFELNAERLIFVARKP
ncbi:MAG: class I SAM-dependent methyltransferase [bacterium]|nr:class I SAM-dependent methyltransferase [bacterium]